MAISRPRRAKLLAAAATSAVGGALFLFGPSPAARAQVTFGSPFQLQAGASTYLRSPGGENRWGDYSATTLDPSDPNSFWTIQEYASAMNEWSTKFTKITVTPGSTTGAIGANFTGSNFNQSGFVPPDTHGAVGKNHFVELINGQYAVYSKTTGVATQRTNLDTFWHSAGVVDAVGTFDPRVFFDPTAASNEGRWFAVAADNADSANSRYLVAVSNAADPTLGWKGFAIKGEVSGNRWADFPTMGFDRDGVYLSSNLFPVTNNPGAVIDIRTSVIVLSKANLINATAGTAPAFTRFDDQLGSDTGFTLQPLVSLDSDPYSVGLISNYGDNGTNDFFRRVNLGGSVNSPTLTPGSDINVGALLVNPPDARQPVIPQLISTNDERLSSTVYLQNGEIWGADGVDVNGRAGVRWFRIRASDNVLLDGGTISDPTNDYYFPSLAVNDNGSVVIGFTASGPNLFASSYAVVGSFAVVPEPGTLGLLGGAAVPFTGLVLARRRRARRAR